MRKNILEYLEHTAARLPDKLAFSTGKEGMSFGEVLRDARAIGSFLAGEGFYAEPVVIFMDKHPHTVTAFFGAVYAGCFYVCIDEKMPPARITAIFESLKPRVMIADRKNLAAAKSLGLERLYLYDDLVTCDTDDERLADIRRRQCDVDAVYVVFTSGSTGVPKGVVACHRSVLDYTEALTEALGFSQDTVFANQTPLYFDAPLKELMPTLKLGATTYFVPKMLFSFPVRLVEYLDEYRINTVCWVVSALVQISALGALENHTPKYLTKVAFGSEVFPRRQYDLWRKALPQAEFYNLYGPTEATGMSCFWHAVRELDAEEPIPVGQPFDNTGLLLLDEENKPAKPGEPGEICLRGTCVTMGYYRNPEKSGEVFVQNPLNSAWDERIYRTGDLGRINEHGELVFLCRKDSQIKHMGHRIELGEIETASLRLPTVSRAACVYDDRDRRIVLFYTGDAVETALAAHLAGLLPRYMLPAVLMRRQSLPLTDNGKLDRRTLRREAEELD